VENLWIHASGSSTNSGTKRRHKGALPLVGESELKPVKLYGVLHQKSKSWKIKKFPRQKSAHITPKNKPFY
jgi:hypothetical protein